MMMIMYDDDNDYEACDATVKVKVTFEWSFVKLTLYLCRVICSICILMECFCISSAMKDATV